VESKNKSSIFRIFLVPQIIHELQLPHVDYLVVLEDVYGLQNYSKKKVCFKSGKGFSESWGRSPDRWVRIIRDLIKMDLLREKPIENETRRRKRILEVTNKFLKVRDKYIGSVKY
jgi:DNA-binding MarR family transcriptional regulator